MAETMGIRSTSRDPAYGIQLDRPLLSFRNGTGSPRRRRRGSSSHRGSMPKPSGDAVSDVERRVVDSLLTFLEDRRLITEDAGYLSFSRSSAVVGARNPAPYERRLAGSGPTVCTGPSLEENPKRSSGFSGGNRRSCRRS